MGPAHGERERGERGTVELVPANHLALAAAVKRERAQGRPRPPEGEEPAASRHVVLEGGRRPEMLRARVELAGSFCGGRTETEEQSWVGAGMAARASREDGARRPPVEGQAAVTRRRGARAARRACRAPPVGRAQVSSGVLRARRIGPLSALLCSAPLEKKRKGEERRKEGEKRGREKREEREKI